MLIDAPQRRANGTTFFDSDRLTALNLPDNGNVVEIARAVEFGMVDENARVVRKACNGLLAEMSKFYRVPPCQIRVFAACPLCVREHWTSKLFWRL